MRGFKPTKVRREIVTIRERPDPAYYAGIDQAAMLTNVSRKTILTRLHAGELEAVKYGRSYYITRISLDKSNISHSLPANGPRLIRMAKAMAWMTREPTGHFRDEAERKAIFKAADAVLRADAKGHKGSLTRAQNRLRQVWGSHAVPNVFLNNRM